MEIATAFANLMKLTQFCLRESRFTLFLVVLILATGVHAFYQIPAAEDPPFVFRFASVQAVLPGAPAKVINQSLTRVLEAEVLSFPEVEYTECVSREGVLQILIKLKDNVTAPGPVWDRIDDRLQALKDQLPPETHGPTLNRDLGKIFGVLIGLRVGTGEENRLEAEAMALKQRLMENPEVGEVTILGLGESRVEVALDLESIGLSGVSPLAIPEAIMDRSQFLPGGLLPATDGGQIRFFPSENTDSLDDLRELPIPLLDEATTLPLIDFAEVFASEQEPPREIIRVRGDPGVILAVALTEGMSIRSLGEAINRDLAVWTQTHGEAYPVSRIAYEPRRVEEKLSGLFWNLGESLAIVSLILILLLGIREGVVVAFLIPLSILLSFTVMHLFDLGLNHVAVGGFIVVLGMLVDNNIVMAERILRHLRSGEPPQESAVAAVRELHRPLFVAAGTTVAAFLPIFLAESAAGEYTRPLFQVVAIALFSAEFIVFTITPLLASSCFRRLPKAADSPRPAVLHPTYRRLLRWSIRHRLLIAIFTLVVLVLTFIGILLLPVRFFPPSDRPLLLAEVDLPPGTSIRETEATVLQVEGVLEDILESPDQVRNWATFIGRNPPRFVLNHRTRQWSPEHATLLISLPSLSPRKDLQQKLQARVAEAMPDLDFRVRPLDVGPAIGYPVQIRLKGESVDPLIDVAEQVKNRLQTVEGAEHVGKNWGALFPGNRVVIEEARATELGVTRRTIAGILQAAFGGLEISKMRHAGALQPVVLTLEPGPLESPDAVLDLEFQSPADGRFYPLRTIASLEPVEASPVLWRHSGSLGITVFADNTNSVSPGAIEASLLPWLQEQSESWEEQYGIHWEFWGESLQARAANQSLLEKVPLAAILIFALLLFQVKSFRSTLVVLIAVPLGGVGAVLGLWIMGESLSFMSLIGLVSLGGIVVNSALLILDRIRLNREAGMDPGEAVIDAAEQRFRAILLTSITTIGGMLPLLLFGGDFWRPMAAALIFGLAIATLLILIIIPVFYCVLFRIGVELSPDER